MIEAERIADRLVAFDLSYRFVEGMKLIRDWVQSGELGAIFAVQATFHNAYGPNKAWFYQRSLSGGGCLLDLGIHLVDLALWTLDWPKAKIIGAQLLSRAERCERALEVVEDYAVAQVELDNGIAMSVACSWNLPLGREAEIDISFLGSAGGASLKNVHGSFFDFNVERYCGTKTDVFPAGDRCW